MTDTNTSSQPKLFSQCVLVYDALAVDADEGGIWIGKITKIVIDLGINIGGYSRIKQRLDAMGCIEMLNAGSSSIPSTIKINHPPTIEMYRQAGETLKNAKSGNEATQQMMRDLNNRMIALETKVARLENVEWQKANSRDDYAP